MPKVDFDNKSKYGRQKRSDQSSKKTGFLIDFMTDKGIARNKDQAIAYLRVFAIVVVIITLAELAWAFGLFSFESSGGGAEGPLSPPTPTQPPAS